MFRTGVCCQQVGAQNAGKSSLINAMKRAVRHGKPRNELTTAALPGTTLGTACLHVVFVPCYHSGAYHPAFWTCFFMQLAYC